MPTFEKAHIFFLVEICLSLRSCHFCCASVRGNPSGRGWVQALKLSSFLKLVLGTEKFSSNEEQTSNCPHFSTGIKKHSKTFRFQNLFLPFFWPKQKKLKAVSLSDPLESQCEPSPVLYSDISLSFWPPSDLLLFPTGLPQPLKLQWSLEVKPPPEQAKSLSVDFKPWSQVRAESPARIGEICRRT